MVQMTAFVVHIPLLDSDPSHNEALHHIDKLYHRNIMVNHQPVEVMQLDDNKMGDNSSHCCHATVNLSTLAKITFNLFYLKKTALTFIDSTSNHYVNPILNFDFRPPILSSSVNIFL